MPGLRSGGRLRPPKRTVCRQHELRRRPGVAGAMPARRGAYSGRERPKWAMATVSLLASPSPIAEKTARSMRSAGALGRESSAARASAKGVDRERIRRVAEYRDGCRNGGAFIVPMVGNCDDALPQTLPPPRFRAGPSSRCCKCVLVNCRKEARYGGGRKRVVARRRESGKRFSMAMRQRPISRQCRSGCMRRSQLRRL